MKKVIYPPAVSGAARLEERLEYDTVGNVKKRIDTANRETLYDYDAAHRLIKTTDALSKITQFEYNARSQMTKVRDALNQAYLFTYDPLGRQLSQTRAGSTMRYEYDAVGNRIKRIDYLARETTYEYDVLNRLRKINYLAGAGNPVPNQTATYTYDNLSRLTSAVNDVGTVAFTYDNRDRITTTTDVVGHVVEYSYDANGNRTLLKLDGASYAAYAYDIADRVTGITNVSDSTTLGFGYDNADRLTSRAYPNGVNTTYEYDGMSRLTRLKDANSAATLFDRELNYNAANQISSISEPEYPRRFGYDNLDRLSSTVYKGGLATTETYAYDAVGNRTASHRSSSYSYQPFNKLTSTQTATYNYDANGHMVSKSEGSNFWRYTWDHENRMGSASTRRQSVRYKYDALGRRIQRTLGGGKENTQFIYDGLDVLVDDNSGTSTKYLNGSGIDNKLRIQTGSSVNYFLTDHLGSTNGLADSSGNLTGSTSYDSFGNATNNLTTRYQYTGREYDSLTGLHYYRVRWYDTNLGRFISEDPIGFDSGDVNLFVYVWNMPQSFMDPFGLQRKDANQRASRERARRQARINIEKALAQPQVQPENLDPGTGNSWWDWGKRLRDIGKDLAKTCLGLPTGKLPKARAFPSPFRRPGFKAGAPLIGDFITQLVMAPEYYNAAHAIASHNHDLRQNQRCVTGPCSLTPYDPRGGLTDNTQKYEDFDWWQTVECKVMGTCGLVCLPFSTFCF